MFRNNMAEPFADETSNMEGLQMKAQQTEEVQETVAIEEYQETAAVHNEERSEVRIEKTIFETVIEQPSLIGTPRVSREYQPDIQDMAYSAYGLKDNKSAPCKEQADPAPEIQEQVQTMSYAAPNIKNKNKRVDPSNMSNEDLMKLWAKNQQH